MYVEWPKVAPDPSSFPTLIDKIGELLRLPYDWPDDVRVPASPVLLIYGDAEHPAVACRRVSSLLGGGLRDAGWDGSLPSPSRLAVLPGRTHYTS
jgi:hypothetical protein